MKIQVLISTMNQNDYSLLDKMNIQTDAIVINQCDKNEVDEFLYKGHKILWMSFNERGIGLSRNNALLRSTADICLIADDDMVYVDKYAEIVEQAFQENKKADMILFNVPIHKKEKTVEKISFNKRIRFYNALKFGSVNFAFKREKVQQKNIWFSIIFGASKYGSGEDSIFITDVLRNKLKIYTKNNKIANIFETRESTWFKGYDEKYLFDRGALFAAIGGKWLSKMLNIQFLLRKKHLFKNDETSFVEKCRIMNEGRKDYLNLSQYMKE